MTPFPGSSGKFLSGAIKAEKSDNPVAVITQATSPAENGIEVLGDAFHEGMIDPGIPPSNNVGPMAEKWRGRMPQMADARFAGPSQH